MISNILYFLPCIVSFLWLILFALKKKTLSQRFYMAMAFCCVIYFTCYALYISPWTDYDLMVKLDSLGETFILLIMALNIICLHSHRSMKLTNSPWHYLLYLPAIIVLTASIVLYSLVGFDSAATFTQRLDELHGNVPPEYHDTIFLTYAFINITLFRVVSCTFLIITYVDIFLIMYRNDFRLMRLIRFWFHNEATTPIRAVCLLDVFALLAMSPLAFLGRSFMIVHPELGSTLSVILAIILHFLSYVEYMCTMPVFKLKNLTNFDLANQENISIVLPEADARKTAVVFPAAELSESKSVVEEGQPEEQQELEDKEEILVTAPIVFDNNLLEMVLSALEEKRLYCDPNLSIQSLAATLGTNRTTLSAVINQHFGKSFRQLIANYRIEAAKTFMQQNPEATQEAIAAECGFLSAQSFNTKFKELTGDSPRMWLSKN